MTTDRLSTLRDTPEAIATIYNDYLKASARVRMDQYSAGQAKLAQIGALVQKAQDPLSTLQQKANDSEAAVRSQAEKGVDAEASAECCAQIRWALDHGMGVRAICEQLVADADRGGFIALRQLLPWAIRAGLIEGMAQPQGKTQFDNAVKQQREIIAVLEAPLLSDNERAARAELQEVDANMGPLRNNFQVVQGFLSGQLLPSAVQGSFQRLPRLFNWVPFIDGRADPGTPASIRLVDDIGGNGPRTASTPFDPSASPYVVRS